MKRPFPLLLGVLFFSSCAPAGGPVSGAAPQTTAISIGGDALMGSGTTVMVTSHRELRGSSHRVEAMIDEVWRVLPAVYRELDVPVGTVNTAARTMGNAELTLGRTLAGERISRYLNCGAGPSGHPLADQYRVQISLLTVLHPEEAGTTRVETRLSGTATNRGASGTAMNCGSNGRLEARIAQALALRVTL